MLHLTGFLHSVCLESQDKPAVEMTPWLWCKSSALVILSSPDLSGLSKDPVQISIWCREHHYRWWAFTAVLMRFLSQRDRCRDTSFVPTLRHKLRSKWLTFVDEPSPIQPRRGCLFITLSPPALPAAINVKALWALWHHFSEMRFHFFRGLAIFFVVPSMSGVAVRIRGRTTF